MVEHPKSKSTQPRVTLYLYEYPVIQCMLPDRHCHFPPQAEVGPDSPVDLVLLSSMLKDISRVEADVVSHGEAVLNGRLSKSQQRLIQGGRRKVELLGVCDK